MKDLNNLAEIIVETHDIFQKAAVRSVNKFLSIRNWLIGYHIVEYEQHGNDRATYRSSLLTNLSKRINKKGLGLTTIKNARLFYNEYVFLAPSILSHISNTVPQNEIRQLATDELEIVDSESNKIRQTPTDLLLNNDYQQY